MWSFKTIIRKPILNRMFFRHNSHKNLCLIAIVYFFLVCLTSLPSLPPHFTLSQTAKVDEETHLAMDPCSGRLIYIHDLPSKFNQDLLTDCKNLNKQVDFCPLLKNCGFGPVMNDAGDFMSGGSWHATSQFTASVIFHNRMKQYDCLTNDSSLASAIYAPFYPGLEMRRFMKREWFDNSVRDAMGQDFVKWLRGRPEWGVMLGWNHFFVSGRITWDLRRRTNPFGKWGTKLLDLPESRNITVLAIESSPYGTNDFAIPYPTHFHPSSDSEVVEWQDRVRRENRRYLFAFTGAPRSGTIRDKIITECTNSSRCKLLTCVGNDMCDRPDNVIKMFMESDFCLQPTGDSYTRRSTFDSILAGCIPVFFHPGSAYVQYLWHFPQNYRKYSVFIPMDVIKNASATVEGVLSQIPEEHVTALKEEVIGLIPKIIYAKKKLEKFEDAFDITIKHVLERIEGARRLIQEGKDLHDEFPEASSWKYYLTGKLEKHEWDSFF